MKFPITLLFLPFSLFAQQEKVNNSISFNTGALTQFGSYSEFYNRGASYQLNWVYDINPIVGFGLGMVAGSNKLSAYAVKSYVRASNNNTSISGQYDFLEDKNMSYSAYYASVVLGASLKKIRLFVPLKFGIGLYTSTGYLYEEEFDYGFAFRPYHGVKETEYIIPTTYKSAGIGISYTFGKRLVANVLCEFSNAVIDVDIKDDITNKILRYGELYRKDISNWSLGAGLGVKLGAGK